MMNSSSIMVADQTRIGQIGSINIVPSSDLRNNYSKIHDLSTSTGEPVFITKNGYADGVFFSMEAFAQYKSRILLMFEDEITTSMYLDDLQSMREGGGQDARQMLEDVKKELGL